MLFPSTLTDTLHPLLHPLRVLAQRRWINEASVDAWTTLLHPAWRLNRVVAQVVSRRWVAADMLAVRLRANRNWRGFKPGQHVMVTVNQGGMRHSRSYSLTGTPDSPVLELGVKRVQGGRVSNFMLDHLHVGALVELGAPFGDLQPAEPHCAGLLLLAGGSGITPLLSLLRSALAQGYGKPVVLLQYVREAALAPFAGELSALAAQHANLHVSVIATGGTEEEMRAASPSAAQLGRWLSKAEVVGPGGRGRPDPSAYAVRACGPAPFVASVQAWWACSPQRGSLQVEAFTPVPLRGRERAATVRVALHRAGARFEVSNQRPLLEQIEEQGWTPASGCRIGICHACACHKRSGAVQDLRTGEIRERPNELIQLCVSAPLSDVVLDI